VFRIANNWQRFEMCLTFALHLSEDLYSLAVEAVKS